MVKLENTLNRRFHQHVKSDTMSWSDTMSSTCHGETMQMTPLLVLKVNLLIMS